MFMLMLSRTYRTPYSEKRKEAHDSQSEVSCHLSFICGVTFYKLIEHGTKYKMSITSKQ